MSPRFFSRKQKTGFVVTMRERKAKVNKAFLSAVAYDVSNHKRLEIAAKKFRFGDAPPDLFNCTRVDPNACAIYLR